MLRLMSSPDDVWIPLVDEPIGSIVAQIQQEDPEIERLVATPHRILAFRTFAYIRVGIVLGQLLVEHDVEPYDGTETWVDTLLREPRYHDAVRREIRAVAEAIAADARDRGEETLGPDDDARARFRDFAKNKLDAV
jgi:hypothetical protein